MTANSFAARSAAPHATRASSAEYRPAYGVATLVALVVLVLYTITLSPTAAMWDAGEYTAAVENLGLPHPPGNPFFMLVGHAFGLIPIASYAQRINFLTALASAASAGLWFLITERVLSAWLPERWERIAGAVVAALLGATAFTVWNQSVVAEKVYTFSLLFVALESWLMVRWADNPDGPLADRILVIVGLLLGLGYANHPAGFLAVPAIGLVVLVRRWQTIMRWRLVLAILGALALGLTPFAYEPIRAAQFPNINEGEPTGCATKIEVSCTLSKLTAQRLEYNINREQYGAKEGRGAPYTGQVGMWWLYFEWQWFRDPTGNFPGVQVFLALIFLGLGLLGGYAHWREDRRSFWYFGPLMFTMTLALIYYLNFKYGYSQAPELGDNVAREVRDRDYFYIWSFSAWGVWAALGLVFVWQSVAYMIGRESVTRTGMPGRRASLMAAPVLALALVPLVSNWNAASRAGETFTRDWAADILNSVEPYGILVTNGDNDTFPLWYAQEVEGIREDVLVVVTSYLNIDWFLRQIVRRPVATYDAARGPAIYRGKTWVKPSGPPLKMSLEEVNALPEYIELREPQLFRQGNISATVPPGILTRDQIVVLRFIKDSYPQRPLYFSFGGYPRTLGLGDYTVRQGLVEKLMPNAVKDSGGVVTIADSKVDVPLSYTLWSSVYKAPQALIRQGRWIDRASANMPQLYAVTGTIIAEGLQQLGNSAAAARVNGTVRQIAVAAGLEQFLALAGAGGGGG